ncbi:MAG: hypothetical protein HY518_04400 [Candidatus Aenigmarchaeota archaeon]|nr:hypothetical protein [Candidatus Aenigmarchaeota archaeon]
MGYKSLDEVPELDVEHLPVEDGLRVAKIVDRAEIAYNVGFIMGIRDGKVARDDTILIDMRYVLGKDTEGGRLYALAQRDGTDGDTARFDPEHVHRDTFLNLDSIESYRSLDGAPNADQK